MKQTQQKSNPANPQNYYLTHFSLHESAASMVREEIFKAALEHRDGDLFRLEIYGA